MRVSKGDRLIVDTAVYAPSLESARIYVLVISEEGVYSEWDDPIKLNFAGETLERYSRPLPDGWIERISLYLDSPSSNKPVGVRVRVLRGAPITPPQDHLLTSMLYGGRHAWYGAGVGEIEAAPATEALNSIITPDGSLGIRLLAFRLTLNCSAVVGDRQVRIQAVDNDLATTNWRITSAITQPAGSTGQYSGGIGMAQWQPAAGFTGDNFSIPDARLVGMGGHTISVQVSGAQAGDFFSNDSMSYELFPTFL